MSKPHKSRKYQLRLRVKTNQRYYLQELSNTPVPHSCTHRTIHRIAGVTWSRALLHHSLCCNRPFAGRLVSQSREENRRNRYDLNQSVTAVVVLHLLPEVRPSAYDGAHWSPKDKRGSCQEHPFSVQESVSVLHLLAHVAHAGDERGGPHGVALVREPDDGKHRARTTGNLSLASDRNVFIGNKHNQPRCRQGDTYRAHTYPEEESGANKITCP